MRSAEREISETSSLIYTCNLPNIIPFEYLQYSCTMTTLKKMNTCGCHGITRNGYQLVHQNYVDIRRKTFESSLHLL